MQVFKVIVVATALFAVAHAAERSDPFIADEGPSPATRQPRQAQQPLSPGQTIKSDATLEKRTLGARDPMLKVAPSGPAQPVVRSESVNVTATPTTGSTAAQAEQRAKKPATPSLLDVKVKGTTVTISPAGVIRTRNPDVDVDVMKVAQMIAQFVQTIRKIVEAGKEQTKVSAPKKAPGSKLHRIRAMKAGDEEEAKPEGKAKAKKDKEKKEKEEESEEEEDEGEGPAAPPPSVVIQQKVSIHTDDSDGARELPLDHELVDDAKPYARKLPFRVRREAIRGASSVGNINFEGAASPILMQLQAVPSTIPKSGFAPDAYRFAVSMEGVPSFVVELPAF